MREIVGQLADVRKSTLALALALLVAGVSAGPVVLGAPPPASAPCGSLTAEGCCLDEILWYCDGGRARAIDCGDKPRCGWRRSGKYDCNTSGQIDPSGGFVKYCQFGADSLPFSLPKRPPSSDACGGVPRRGCCAGEVLRYCVGGHLREIDCRYNQHCGFRPSTQVYNCGTEGETDPRGRAGKACPELSSDAGQAMPDAGLAGRSAPAMGRSGAGCAASGAPLPGWWVWCLAVFVWFVRQLPCPATFRRQLDPAQQRQQD